MRRFFFEKDRRQYVAAHALARRMLSEETGGSPGAWRFAAGVNGKPFVVGRQDLEFSLSHCDGRVACAVSRGRPLGVDVEPSNRAVEVAAVARFLAQEEAAWIKSLSVGAHSDALIRLWTLKEAIVKATGRGLSQPLDSFVVDVERLEWRAVDPSAANGRDWGLRQWRIGGFHVVALAWRAHAPTPKITLKSVIPRTER